MAESDRHPGPNKVSKDPIHLHIHSPNVPNLTLIDLPGLVKVAIKNLQKDIEDQIRRMILGYVRNENCIILAITPGIVNIAISDSLKLAAEVDKKGKRTIGVITKMDMVTTEDTSEILKTFNNELYQLDHGYFGVKCRSQADINANKSIEAALKDESDYFENHTQYKNIADFRVGTRHLCSALSKLLGEHIRERLPKLQEKWRKQESSLSEEIDAFKNLHPTDHSAMVRTLNM